MLQLPLVSGSELAITSGGVLTFASTPDYETKSSYSATVTASDGTNSSTQDITVTVTNANDNSPVLTQVAFSVVENQTGIGTITTDDDGDTLSFSLSGTDASSMSINSSSGVLVFNSAPDYETKTSYSATVTASDAPTLRLRTLPSQLLILMIPHRSLNFKRVLQCC